MVHFFLQMLTRQADASPPVAWHDQHSDCSAPDEADSSSRARSMTRESTTQDCVWRRSASSTKRQHDEMSGAVLQVYPGHSTKKLLRAKPPHTLQHVHVHVAVPCSKETSAPKHVYVKRRRPPALV